MCEPINLKAPEGICLTVAEVNVLLDPDPFKALQLAIRSGLMSRSEAISSFGYDAETIDKEIAADNARADALGLVLDTDPRQVARNGATNSATPSLPPDSPSAPLVDQQT